MEAAVIVFLLFPAYILIRLAMGHHLSQADKDDRKFKEGYDLIKSRNFTKALEYFNKEIKRNPQSAKALLSRAKVYEALREPYNAIKDADKATRYDATLWEAYFIKGKVLYDFQEYQTAQREFEKSVWYNSKFAEGYCWKAKCLTRLGKHKEAYEDLCKARELGDENANYFLMQKAFVE